MHGVIQQSKGNLRWIFGFAILASLGLSLWINLHEYVVNPDAICYLQSAASVKDGLYAAIHICDQAKWPLYAFIIYYFSIIAHLSTQTSAYVIDAIFSAITVITFMSIVHFIVPRVRVVILAAIVILLAHEFNSIRQYIVRDHGFWAFYLMSIFAMLHFFQDLKWRYAFAWSLCIGIATLFRVEGALFYLLAPLVSFFDCRHRFLQRVYAFIKLNLITICGISVFATIFAIHPHLQLTRVGELQFQIMHGSDFVVQHFSELKQSFAKNILTADSANEAGVVLFLMFASWYLYSVVMNLSVIYTFLVVYGWVKKSITTERTVYPVLFAYIAINVLITAVFLAEHMFLSKRYLIAMSLVLMFWVPFALDMILDRWKKWCMGLLLFIMLVSSLGGILDFGYSKKYIYDAGQWLSENAPANASIYSNDYQVLYYSHHFGNDIFDKAREYNDLNALNNGVWKQFDYLAIRVTKNEESTITIVMKQINFPLVKEYSNKRGDQVKIFRRN